MPSCKKCHARITRFDRDICPVCGEKNPLEGVNSETIEITSNLDLSLEELNNFKPSTKAKTMVLFFAIGWTGAPQFYLGYILQGFLMLFINLAVAGGIFSLFYFVVGLDLILSIIIPVTIIYAINIILGFFAFFKHNLKDKSGEFLR